MTWILHQKDVPINQNKIVIEEDDNGKYLDWNGMRIPRGLFNPTKDMFGSSDDIPSDTPNSVDKKFFFKKTSAPQSRIVTIQADYVGLGYTQIEVSGAGTTGCNGIFDFIEKQSSLAVYGDYNKIVIMNEDDTGKWKFIHNLNHSENTKSRYTSLVDYFNHPWEDTYEIAEGDTGKDPAPISITPLNPFTINIGDLSGQEDIDFGVGSSAIEFIANIEGWLNTGGNLATAGLISAVASGTDTLTLTFTEGLPANNLLVIANDPILHVVEIQAGTDVVYELRQCAADESGSSANVGFSEPSRDGASITWDWQGKKEVNGFINLESDLGAYDLTIVNQIDGASGTLVIFQGGGSGNNTLILNSASKVINNGQGAVVLSTGSNQTDVLSFLWHEQLGLYFVTIGNDFSQA